MRFVAMLLALVLVLPSIAIAAKEKKGSVKGTVHKNSASGPGLAGVKVSCGGKSDTTDSKGKFKIEDISKGSHEIKFSRSGYDSFTGRVDISSGKTSNVGDRWLIEKPSPNPPPNPGKCPNGNGLYCGDPSKGQDPNHLYQCKDGKYTEKSDCSNNGCQNNDNGKDDSCKPQPIPGPKTGSVKGKVHSGSASGPALSGVNVACAGKSVTTGSDGSFKIVGIALGRHAIEFSKSGYQPFSGRVEITAGTTASVGDRWLEVKTTDPPSTRFSWKGPAMVANFNNRGYCYPQCVEFVRYNIPNIASNGNAENYWQTVPKGYTRYPEGNQRAPRPGDLLVWEGWRGNAYGHIAIVTSIDLVNNRLNIAHSNYDYNCSSREESWNIRFNNGYYIDCKIKDVAFKGWLSKD